jgi:hypothetical protein
MGTGIENGLFSFSDDGKINCPPNPGIALKLSLNYWNSGVARPPIRPALPNARLAASTTFVPLARRFSAR